MVLTITNCLGWGKGDIFIVFKTRIIKVHDISKVKHNFFLAHIFKDNLTFAATICRKANCSKGLALMKSAQLSTYQQVFSAGYFSTQV